MMENEIYLFVDAKFPKEGQSRAAHGNVFAWTTAFVNGQAELGVSWQVTVLHRQADPLIPTVMKKWVTQSCFAYSITLICRLILPAGGE